MKQLDYSALAKDYDILEGRSEESNLRINHLLSKLLKKNNCKNILDFSCGTGAQAGFLDRKGFSITAVDINKEMMKIAKKRYGRSSKINFLLGDMQNSFFGEYDAVLTIFNSISHLSEKEFRISLRNIARNLKRGGVYIFDVFNFEFLKKRMFNTKQISIANQINNVKYVVFSNFNLDLKKKMFSINQQRFIQKNSKKIESRIENWEQKVYSIEDLKKITREEGFNIYEVLDSKGNHFNKNKSLMIFMVIKKN